LRQDLRVLVQLGKNFEIQRQATAISLRRLAGIFEVEDGMIREPLRWGPPTVQPRTEPLWSALTAVCNAQNNLLAVYLQYQKRRFELFQDLGLTRFDERGMWIDEALGRNLAADEPAFSVPPEIRARARSKRGAEPTDRHEVTEQR
jgi:hypothetical protein